MSGIGASQSSNGAVKLNPYLAKRLDFNSKSRMSPENGGAEPYVSTYTSNT